MKEVVRAVILVGVTAAFVALTVAHLPADVCVYKPPKVRRICGVTVGPDGAAVPGVRVTIQGCKFRRGLHDRRRWRVQF